MVSICKEVFKAFIKYFWKIAVRTFFVTKRTHVSISLVMIDIYFYTDSLGKQS